MVSKKKKKKVTTKFVTKIFHFNNCHCPLGDKIIDAKEEHARDLSMLYQLMPFSCKWETGLKNLKKKKKKKKKNLSYSVLYYCILYPPVSIIIKVRSKYIFCLYILSEFLFWSLLVWRIYFNSYIFQIVLNVILTTISITKITYVA